MNLSNPDYCFEDMEPVAGVEYVIDPKVVEFAWDNNTFIYNGLVQASMATVTNLENGDICNVTVEYLDSIDPGDYLAKAVGLDNENYIFPKDTSIVEFAYKILAASVPDGSAADTGDSTGSLVFLLLLLACVSVATCGFALRRNR
ncbi:MAG: hypothetical protein HUJ51_03055 [Eggerthellaceae bacterium]|nr:hypothetical protein [Eggerthellaceae bacterium]